MEVKAKLRYLRMSPRKVRLVAGLIRGKNVQEAVNQLRFSPKAAAKPMLKLVESVLANATNNFDLSADNLRVHSVMVDQGPTLKRWMPKAHGRATPLRKKTSHIDIVLAEIKDSGKREGKKVAVAAPVKLSGRPAEEEGVKLESQEETNEKVETKEQGKVRDSRNDGRVSRAKADGGKGHAKRVFNRKSG